MSGFLIHTCTMNSIYVKVELYEVQWLSVYHVIYLEGYDVKSVKS